MYGYVSLLISRDEYSDEYKVQSTYNYVDANWLLMLIHTLGNDVSQCIVSGKSVSLLCPGHFGPLVSNE